MIKSSATRSYTYMYTDSHLFSAWITPSSVINASVTVVCVSNCNLKVYLSSVWISIEQSVMVSGIMGFVTLWFVIGHQQLILLIMGGPLGHWQI